MDFNAKCPSCKNDKWELEADHAHCSECHSVVRFDEIRHLLLYGKLPLDKKIDDLLQSMEDLP